MSRLKEKKNGVINQKVVNVIMFFFVNLKIKVDIAKKEEKGN